MREKKNSTYEENYFMQQILPQGFQVRRPTMDDLQAVTQLFVKAETAEHGGPEINQEDIRSLWNDKDFNLETDAWLVFTDEGQLVGYADMEQRYHAKIFSLLKIDPEFVGRGIEEYLLSLAEEWAGQQMELAEAGMRVTLDTYVGARYQPMQQLFEQAGFHEIRRSWRMEIDMDSLPPEPEWPEGVTVRTFVPGQDEWATFKTVDTAFEDHFGHIPGIFEEWKHWTVEREDFNPSLFFLAFDGDEMAGCSLCAYTEDKKQGDGWVNTLAVLRPWRRKGLGMALLRHSFQEFYRLGKRRVGLGVDSQNLTGATRLYHRAGMHVAREYISYEKELRAGVELATQAVTA
jgi:mycothiol synthase